MKETVNDTLAAADQMVERVIGKNHLPGVAVAIVYRGNPIYAKGFGRADLSTSTPVTPDTVFRIASVSKTFAAISLMQLWEQGRFDLHDPVNDYLRAFHLQQAHSYAEPVTFHHLLTHTGGIGEFIKLSKYLRPRTSFNVVRPHNPVPPLSALYGRSLKVERYPGEKWCYANNGYATIGQLVADISGQPFPDYMRQHVFDPLGMVHADFQRSERVRHQLATGYAYPQNKVARAGHWLADRLINRADAPVDDPFMRVPDLEQITTAAGAMYATIRDMSLYLAALMNGGANGNGRILQSDTLQMMFTPQFQLDPHLQGMGYGFFIDEWNGHRIASHDGLWLGFISSMFVAPDDELGVVVLTNRADSSAIGLARGLLKGALGVGSRHRHRSSTAPAKPALREALIGRYSPAPGFNTNFRLWQQHGNEFQVFLEGEDLKLRSIWGGLKGGITLRPLGDDEALVFDAAGRQIIFRRGKNGDPVRLLMGLHAFYKRPFLRSVRFRLLLLPFIALIFVIAIIAAAIIANR